IASVSQSAEPDKDFAALMEDHEQKLFWAIWSLPIDSPDQFLNTFQRAKDLSRDLHSRRLASLYVNPHSETEKIDPEEVNRLRSAVSSQLEMERLSKLQPLSHAVASDISWFFQITQDKEQSHIVFGQTSLNKLAELKDPAEWLKWLKDIFAAQELASKNLLESELSRQAPSGKE